MGATNPVDINPSGAGNMYLGATSSILGDSSRSYGLGFFSANIADLYNIYTLDFGGGAGGSGDHSVINRTALQTWCFALGTAPTNCTGTVNAGLFNSTANGAVSTSPVTATGSWFTGGSGTTTKPQVLIEPTGTSSTSWSTNGTGLGIDAVSGFTGMLIDAKLNGLTQFFVDNAGDISGRTLGLNHCTSNASPALCGASPSGLVAVPAGGATLVVDTSAVSAGSQIQLTFDSSLGTALGVTCNTSIGQPTVSARTAGTSFTITMSASVSTNPACISYTLIN